MMRITLKIVKKLTIKQAGALFHVFAIGLIGLPTSLIAAKFALPETAKITRKEVNPLAEYAVPTGIWENGAIPTFRAQGKTTRTAWYMPQSDKTTLQILQTLHAQLLDQDYRVIFTCEDQTCGGFDFRFGTEVLADPDMFVDLSNYQFLSAARNTGFGDQSYITLLVSQSATRDYVQSIHVEDDKDTDFKVASPTPLAPLEENEFTEALETNGYVILSDLLFKSGSSVLADKTFASLGNLAGFLKSHPRHRIALVGHSDNIGDLAGNMALSKARAQAVAVHLSQAYKIKPEQLFAAGTGYLSPIASNLTAEGRRANRRVEAVLLSNQ